MKTIFRVHALLLASALTLLFGPTTAEAQKALVYCPASDQSGCTTVRSALLSAFPGGVETGDDGTNGSVDLKTVDLFQYAVVFVPSLAETDSTKPYTLLRDQAVVDRLKLTLLGRRAFWSGTPDQGGLATTRPAKDALIQNLAAWASADFGTVNAPGLVVLQDNSDVVTSRYSWVQPILGFQVVADPRLATYSGVQSLTAAGNAILTSNGSTLAFSNMASFGFQTPGGASGLSIDGIGKTTQTPGGQVVLMTQMGANTGGAVITTDTDDYPPGTPVIMTGTGFGAGETVTLTLHEDPQLYPDLVFTVTADANGRFVYSGFAPDAEDIDVRFVLTAKGQSSGRQAQTTFTDAQPQTVTLTPSSVSVPPGGSAQYTVAVGVGGNSTNCTIGLSVSTPLPTGVTATFSGGANPFTTNAGFSRTLTLQTTNTGTPSGRTVPGNYSFTVSASRVANCQGNGTVTATGTLVVPSATALALGAPSPATVAPGSTGPVTLTATLTRTADNTAINGASVGFTVDGNSVGSATTNASGVATIANYNPTALGTGPHTVQATFAQAVIGTTTYEASTSGTQTLTVGKTNQTIAFGSIADKTFGDAAFVVTATATSGLPVSFAAAGNCSINTSTNTVSLTGAGSCTVTASQAGNASFNPAPDVPQSFQIAKAQVTLALNGLAATYDGQPKLATVTTTPANIPGVTITYDGAPSAPVNAGTYAVIASLTNNDYTATNATGNLVIARAQPQFSNLSAPAVTYGATTATISGILLAGAKPPTGSVTVVVAGTGGSLTIPAATINQTTGAFSASFDPSAVPANSAGYDVALSTPQTQNFEAAFDNSLKLVVNKASQAITFGALDDKTFGDPSFTVSATSNSNTPITFSASGACSIVTATVSITGAGSCTITADQAADGNYNAAAPVPQAFNIAKAKATISVNGATITYDGLPHGATGTASGVGGANLTSSLNLTQTFTNVPGGTANWTFDGDPNYEDASGSVQITINRAPGSISITGPAAITYKSTSAINTNKVGDGAVGYAATTGGGSVCTVDASTGAVTMLRGTGSCGITATLAQGANYEGATSTELTIQAAKAVATINVTGFDGVYDTQPHGATGTAVGVGNEDLNAGLNLGASFTDVPGGTANWTFNGGLDYENANGSVEIKIAKADQSTAVTITAPSSMTYGQAPVTLTAAGGNGTGAYQFSVGLSTGCSLAGSALSVVNASQSCAVSAIRLGDNNYNDSPASAAANVSLVKADAVISVTGYSGVYDGQAHGATGTATGAKGEDLSSLLSLGSSFTDVPGGTADWSFSGGANHNVSSGSAAITLTPAPTSTVVTVSGATYDANPHGGTAKVTGVAGLDQSLTVSYTGVNGTSYSSTTAPTGAGDYTASASYAATTNYQASSDSKPFTIAKRAISVQPIVTNAALLVWTGSPLTPAYTLGLAAGSLPLAGSDAFASFGVPVFSPTSVTNVGQYISTVSGLTSANYAITPVNGTVNVLDKTNPTGSITSLNPVRMGVQPTLVANFTDATTGNSNIIAWKYSLDGVDQPVLGGLGAPSGTVTQQLAAYNTTDVVSVCVSAQDAGGNWSVPSCALLAIYDPTTGFVTGGGWIDSPAGAYLPDPTLKGKANFGFVSKYLKGANTPSGNTEFQFHEGNLNFKSTNFQWLVIQGTSMSQFKGTGTINGAGSYNFLVTAIDGDQVAGTKKPDSFRIKITQGTTLIYDNQMNADETSASATVLSGGSIQIQSK